MKLIALIVFVFVLNSQGNYCQWEHIATIGNNDLRNEKNVSDKYTITLTLPKFEYKKYEPVIAKIVLTNHDTKPLDIYNIHDNLSGEPHFTIKDKYGNVYDSRNMVGFFIPTYTSEVPPGDSLVFSMTMNEWGKPTSYETTKNLDEVYFSQFGYFPVDDYSAYFHCSPLRNGEEIFSNKVVFKVIDLTQEDIEVLQLYKENKYNKNKYDEIVSRYPNNVFIEHILKRKMSLYYSSKITDNTESDYNDFIQKYPNSMYFYNWTFMLPYIKAAEQKQNSFESGVDYLLSIQSQESLAKQSLSSNAFTTIIKNYGKVFEKNK